LTNNHPELFQRNRHNPILTAADWPYPINSVFNAAATLMPDGTTLLLCRAEDRRGHSHLCVARSVNGFDGWQIDPQPTMPADIERYPEELWGIEDPRITFVPELNKYAVVYTAYSKDGPGVALAMTEDFHTYERIGLIMPPEDKDAALLPYRIGGYWALIHRPVGGPRAHMWISYSPDLRHWGSHKLMLEARRGAWWDANKIGLSPPPIETPRGWLIIYHGVRMTAAGAIYRTRRSACSSAATSGSSAPRSATNSAATWATSSFPAATPSSPMATRSISTTARPIRASPWRRAASDGQHQQHAGLAG